MHLKDTSYSQFSSLKTTFATELPTGASILAFSQVSAKIVSPSSKHQDGPGTGSPDTATVETAITSKAVAKPNPYRPTWGEIN